MAIDPISAGILGGGILAKGVGDLLGASARARAAKARARALNAIANQYDPYLFEASQQDYTVDGTALDEFQADAQADAAQRKAMMQLQEVAAQGGFNAEDRAAIAMIEQEQLARNQAARQAILQQAAMRGGLTSGGALAAELQASQGSANQARMAGLQQAALGRRRAMDAMSQSYDAAANLRGQTSQEQMQKLAARDAINQFNSQARRGQFQDKMNVFNQQKGYRGQAAGARQQAGQAWGDVAPGVGNTLAGGLGAFQDYRMREKEADRLSGAGDVYSADDVISIYDRGRR